MLIVIRLARQTSRSIPTLVRLVTVVALLVGLPAFPSQNPSHSTTDLHSRTLHETDEILTVQYQHPVSAIVIDPFRMDHGRYGPGNRGLEYNSRHGDLVSAAADGIVLVARVVVGRGVVTLLHQDGLRTAVTGLDNIDVWEGATVQRGDRIGTAAGPIHFSLRDGEEYLDPALFVSVDVTRKRSRAVLVPTPRDWY